MPLRDHFHPPLKDRVHWEGFHSAWTNTIVRHLNTRLLPPRYRSEPQVHLGALVEVDVATFEEETGLTGAEAANGGVATAVWAPPRPAQTFAVDLHAPDVFEVRVYDDQRSSRLVAAVELVSPGNKDRREHREAFVVKCAAYLRQRVAVMVVDVITERHANLHAALLEALGRTDHNPWPADVHLYAVAYRATRENDAWQMEIWPERLAVGAALPTLPLWLARNLAAPLDLEATYEETCQVLRLR
jgi:Protein of unknown function (DUF4058)